jgi:tRNA N6-adenosine threonylcarbamoyltransferase
MRVLALETSCDETSAAIVRRHDTGVTLESLAILSQDVHRIFGGVVPELASRAHLATIDAVVDDALRQADLPLDALEGVAVTRGPGLLGALLVGVSWAKTLAWRESLPLVGVHHLEGHLFAPTLDQDDVAPPFLALLVSGGHSMLLDVPAWGDYRLLGQTRDDAVGEAFDKVGSLLGLEYPAGAALERLPATGDPSRFTFPRPLTRDIAGPGAYDLSMSGLKTAVLRAVERSEDLERDRAHFARGFQDAVIDVLVTKTVRATAAQRRTLVVLGGGVACNSALESALRDALGGQARLAVASPRLNTDNAAMIGAAGSWRLARGERHRADLDARDVLPLPGLTRSTGVTT